jgi:hypothetical protein
VHGRDNGAPIFLVLHRARHEVADAPALADMSLTFLSRLSAQKATYALMLGLGTARNKRSGRWSAALAEG